MQSSYRGCGYNKTHGFNLLQERMKTDEGLTTALPSVQQREAAPEDQFSPGILGVESRELNCAKVLIISISAGRGGGVSKSVPILALFSHLSQPRLSPRALSMLLRYVPSCCSNRQRFGPGIQKEILLRTLWEPSRGSATPGKQKHTWSHVLLGD